jgi:hypothetical protein
VVIEGQSLAVISLCITKTVLLAASWVPVRERRLIAGL